jgi:3-amino-4-hydroxybenzoic acid synthase
MKLCWLDIRGCDELRTAVSEEAVHQQIDGIVADDLAHLAALPSTTRKVFAPGTAPLPADLGAADVVVVDATRHGEPAVLARLHEGVEFCRFVEIVDAATLELACESARTDRWSLLVFRDPTKIPLEIVLAAAAGASGSIITAVADVTEAQIVFGVLEHGSDGVLMPAGAVGDATALMAAARTRPPELGLVELEVTAVTRAGMGDRACVDTCSYLGEDEGILVGSNSKGMILCVSETHPLPYMPTRPFRVNAGAIHSYTLAAGGHTRYLSELGAGARVLAVNVKGETRIVTVGRVKIETRPLLSIDAAGSDGRTANLILQDDWHVRILGPGGAVLNSTELRPGDKVLGFLPDQDRHVGYPITEFCLEQ